jgi:ribonuclease HI
VKKVKLITDGACKGNPGPGGWACILRYNRHKRELWGCAAQTTNNRMELTAAIEGLRALHRRCRVRIVTDSQYLKKGMTEWIHDWIRRGWKTAAKKNVLNRDLWESLLELCSRHEVTWEWVKGHAGHEFNERCDQLANEAIDRLEGAAR